MTKPADQTLAHFREHGWTRVPGAFDAEAAAAMRDAVWRALANVGIRQDRPSTWSVERPAHLQPLKDDPVFRAVGSARVLAAIDAVMDGRPYPAPKNWGAFFIAFPSQAEWGVPTSGWHVDAKYTSTLWPPGGVKTHALFGDVPPRSGATQIVSGSHRLIHKWFEKNPPPSDLPGADMRKLLQKHPYIRDLHTEGDRDARIARFMDGVECHEAGDVILLHPLVLHVAAPNTGDQPRFLLSGGVTTDMWGNA